MWWALAAGISAALYCGVAFGTLVPLSDSDNVEYLFVWPGGAAVAIVIASIAVAVLAYALVCLIAGWTLVRADRLLGSLFARRLSAVATWSPVTRVLLGDAVVFAALVAWAIATTPLIRFSSRTVGDEPKYLRYCEVLYQGRGLDVSHKRLLMSLWTRLLPCSGTSVCSRRR